MVLHGPLGELTMDGAGHALDALLAEQLAYYRAKAPEYRDTGIPELSEAELPTRTSSSGHSSGAA